MRLFFLIVFIGLNAFSQKINLGDLRGYQNSSLDTLKHEFHLYFDDHILTIDLFNYEKSITPLALEEGLSPTHQYLNSPSIWVQNNPYFPYGSGGMVYTIKNDTIKRIDNSFNHGMQYGAPVFEHNGTIFKYGGYGFWSVRDFFTYYDELQNEWEVFSPIKSKTIPQGIGFPYFLKNQEEIYIFGGTTVNPYNRREQLNNNEVWVFDFKETTWNLKGKHDQIEEAMIRVPYKKKLLLIQEYQITTIDTERNIKTSYNHGTISAQLKGRNYLSYAQGKFYTILANQTGAYLIIIEEKDFFGKKIEETSFYKNKGYWLKQGGIYALVMGLIILIFWLIKKNFVSRNKIKLLENGLRYRLKFTEFDPESMEIIKLLLRKKEVPSSEILRIVEKDQYSPAHNERIKVQKINDINIKVATLLGITDDLITNFKSSQDRRIRLYKISKEHFIIKSSLKS